MSSYSNTFKKSPLFNPHISLAIIWGIQWTRQYYSISVMREGSIVPDKQKESPKFTEGVTVTPLHLPPPSCAVLARRKKKIPNRRQTKCNMHHKLWPWQHKLWIGLDKAKLRVSKATTLKQKDQSPNQLQPSFSVCLWNVTVIYLI